MITALIAHIENLLLPKARERYEETKGLVGVNCYAAGYELGYIEALEDVLGYIEALSHDLKRFPTMKIQPIAVKMDE